MCRSRCASRFPAAGATRSRCRACRYTALPDWFWMLNVTFSDSGRPNSCTERNFGFLSGTRTTATPISVAPRSRRFSRWPGDVFQPSTTSRASWPAFEAAAVEVPGEVLGHEAVADSPAPARDPPVCGRPLRARTCRSCARYSAKARAAAASTGVRLHLLQRAGLAEGVGHLDDGNFGLRQVWKHAR